MSNHRRAGSLLTVSLAVGLACSLVLNGVLAIRGESPVSSEVVPIPNLANAPSSPCSMAAEDVPSVRVTYPVPVGFDSKHPVLNPFAPAPSGSLSFQRGLVSELTPQLQQELLSQIAREKLRDAWRGQQDSILAEMRKSLADPARQSDDARREGRKLAAAAALDSQSTTKFLAAYEIMRRARLQTVGRALATEPADWDVCLEQLRGLFDDEDALMQSIGGEAAKRRMRWAQAEGRTILLAIGASLANKPWEQAIEQGAF